MSAKSPRAESRIGKQLVLTCLLLIALPDPASAQAAKVMWYVVKVGGKAVQFVFQHKGELGLHLLGATVFEIGRTQLGFADTPSDCALYDSKVLVCPDKVNPGLFMPSAKNPEKLNPYSAKDRQRVLAFWDQARLTLNQAPMKPPDPPPATGGIKPFVVPDSNRTILPSVPTGPVAATPSTRPFTPGSLADNTLPQFPFLDTRPSSPSSASTPPPAMPSTTTDWKHLFETMKLPDPPPATGGIKPFVVPDSNRTISPSVPTGPVAATPSTRPFTPGSLADNTLPQFPFLDTRPSSPSSASIPPPAAPSATTDRKHLFEMMKLPDPPPATGGIKPFVDVPDSNRTISPSVPTGPVAATPSTRPFTPGSLADKTLPQFPFLDTTPSSPSSASTPPPAAPSATTDWKHLFETWRPAETSTAPSSPAVGFTFSKNVGIRNFTLINRSGDTFIALHYKEPELANWNKDSTFLPLASSNDKFITLSEFLGPCHLDVKLTFADGSEHTWEDFDLCQIKSISIYYKRTESRYIASSDYY